MYKAEDVDAIETAVRDIKVTGHKILVVLPAVTEMTAGGIRLTDKMIEAEQIAACVGMVADIGPEAYPENKFKSGAWCKDGDWVVFKPYSGTRIKPTDPNAQIELRLINDDQVEAVISAPEKYRRI